MKISTAVRYSALRELAIVSGDPHLIENTSRTNLSWIAGRL